MRSLASMGSWRIFLQALLHPLLQKSGEIHVLFDSYLNFLLITVHVTEPQDTRSPLYLVLMSLLHHITSVLQTTKGRPFWVTLWSLGTIRFQKPKSWDLTCFP
jgi:hypothetical protein